MADSSIPLHDLFTHPERRISQPSLRSTDTTTSGSDLALTVEPQLDTSSSLQDGEQVPLHTNAQQSTLPCYQPLASDESDLLTDHDSHNLRPVKKNLSLFLAVCAWWIPELFASVVSVAMLGCIVAVLIKYDGHLLTELHLPGHLTLNGIIAALATVNRACLNTPVCSALLQQMWLYLANESKREGTPRSRLRDLELYTEASTGAWGSLLFLCKARSARFAASFGCAITILSLTFSTFTQQLVSIGLVPVQNETSPGNIPRSETYTNLPDLVYTTSGDLQLDILASIHDGVLRTDARPSRAFCPTANCTWPITPTLAVCGACVESAFVQLGCNVTSHPDSPDLWYCYHRLPAGETTQLWDFISTWNRSSGSRPDGEGFQVFPTQNGSRFKPMVDNRAYVANFYLFGLPFLASPLVQMNGGARPELRDIKATECALWMCVQAYNTSTASYIQYDEIVGTFDAVNITDWYHPSSMKDYRQLPAVPEELDRDKSTNFTIGDEAWQMLSSSLKSRLEGNVTILWKQFTMSSSDLISGAWNGSTNPSVWINNVATSMTNAIRTANHTSRAQYNGTQHDLAVVVRWYWLILPATLVVASLVYLAVVMFQTAASPMYSWKGSPLTLLLFELDPRITEAARDRVEKKGELLEAIGDTRVRIERVDGGVRRLNAC